MRRSLNWVIFGVLTALTAAVPARAEDAVKTGGNFEVAVEKDISYYTGTDADKVKHKLDVYVPKDHKDFPVLLWVHGGAWKMGDKKQLFDPYGKLARTLAKNGVGVVVTNYRLSPGVKHPAHVEDVAKAFAWVHENIGKYGGKKDEIFVSGHSAGGHLVALLATDETYLKAEKRAITDIKGVIPISGIYRIPAKMLPEVFGDDEKLARQASPIEHVEGKRPPMLVIYAENDIPTFDESAKNFVAALKKNKNDAEALEIKDRNHLTILLMMSKEEEATTQALLEFIAKHSGLKLTVKE